MHYLLCREKITDFDQWKRDFDSQASAREEAWLYVQNVWRNLDNPEEVFYLFEVVDLDRARDFLGAPDAVRGRSGAASPDVYFLTA